jgi:hypothetical protein
VIAGESANESSDTVRGTVSRSKDHTTGGNGRLRQLFRAAVKAVTRRAEEPAPEPRRRRGGETGKAFAIVAKSVLRRVVRLPSNAYATATAYLADTLDWLNLWQDNAANDHWLDEDFSAKQDRNFPHP